MEHKYRTTDKKKNIHKTALIGHTFAHMEAPSIPTEAAIIIRPLAEADLVAADRTMNLAFGTFLRLPDPTAFMGDADYVHTRWRADPSAAFAAESEGRLVGSSFATCWGSVGFFGPITVHPDHWGKGVATLLLEPVIKCFDRWKIRHAGLVTFADSPKHIGLYRKFGFWPRFLTGLMTKAVTPAPVNGNGGWTRFSAVPQHERDATLVRCRQLTGSIYDGLDLEREIRAVAEQQLGETVLLWNGDDLTGLAVCHCGAGSEAGSGTCYIKVGGVRPGVAAKNEFRRLLTAVEALAAEQGLTKISGGANTGRQEAYETMLECGYRCDRHMLIMERPNEPGYNRPGVYMIDDWR